MNKLQSITLILILLLTAGLQGESISLSLADAWTRMENANSDLKKLRIQWNGAVRFAESHDQLLPSLSAGAGLRRSSPLISVFTSDSTFEELDNWSISGSVDMSFRLSPGLSTDADIRKLREELLALQITQKEKSLKYDLTVLYYQILGGQEKIALQLENVRLSDARLRQTEAKYRQGLVSDLELLSARLSATRDKPALEKEQAAQEKRFITLRGYLGLDDSTEITLVPEKVDATMIPRKDDALLAASSSIDLRILEYQIRLAQLNYDSADSKAFGPSLSTSLGWSTGINPLFRKESWTAEKWRDSISFGLNLSVPLDSHFRGSTEKLNLQSLDDAIQTAEINLDAARQSLQNNIRSLYLDMDLSRSNISIDELNVTLLEQTFGKMEQSYNAGKTSLSDLDDSRQNWKEAVQTLADERRNLTSLTLQLFHLLNLE